MRRLVFLALLTSACAPKGQAPAVPPVLTVQAEEIVGRVVVAGFDPVTWLAIEPSGGGAQTRLGGPGATMLRSVSGAVVWVSGSRVSGEFRVDVFEVRRIGEQDVDDGIVVATSSGVELRSRSGTTRAIPNATPALRDIAGARIWVSRPVAGVTPSYGVIAPKA